MPAATNHTEASALSTPRPTAPATATLSKAEILSNVYSLATAFATCVEAFNLIHPHKDSDHAQKVALTKLGIQQGRLLIFGDAVGISAPPATIARHMVPSRPGLTNPDPTLPVNFGARDARLDQEAVRDKVTRALEEIYGRPAHLSRDQLMDQYGLKQPKRFSTIEQPSLDANRLEAFREKYALLNDLIKQSGIRPEMKSRKGSMLVNHWTVKDVVRFDAFVRTVRIEVDGLIALMGVKEQVDKGMRTDIKAMAWHPDLQSMIVRQDWEKLQLIKEAVTEDYPEYVEVADKALQYIVEELRGTKIHMLREAKIAQASAGVQGVSSEKGGVKTNEQHLKVGAHKEKRPGFWSRISGYKSIKNKSRTQSVVSNPEEIDPQRSLSDGGAAAIEDENGLTTVRSKSLSAIPDNSTPLDIDARIAGLAVHNEQQEYDDDDLQRLTPVTSFHDVPGAEKPHAHVQATLAQVSTRSTVDIDDVDPLDNSDIHGYNLIHADTANSLIDRHDMFRGVGRMPTRDIRDKSHEAAGW
ncbi:hypothetical protein P171DRAFT_434588 [Karstenula rhodostoma CBS 690.94]|uniref:Prion-inhibition and propagation HeLo domain-containing protein n=1 Tax=Karstenula rhodostoma CBS 690.94 TaxID=1392251 RepID=A0A9P4U8F9_9PLEO|nr:hypothetical protein P171DRAFT_434588 [Karstenula rhodostoma CBS 690.94]